MTVAVATVAFSVAVVLEIELVLEIKVLLEVISLVLEVALVLKVELLLEVVELVFVLEVTLVALGLMGLVLVTRLLPSIGSSGDSSSSDSLVHFKRQIKKF